MDPSEDVGSLDDTLLPEYAVGTWRSKETHS
jgi:hypothetical protein